MNDEIKHIVAALLNQMHSNQDDLVVCAKWIGARILLTVPSYMQELEQWVRLLSVTFGSITAFIGMIIMVFKLKDLLSKRKK
jgi:hypothetical protein